MRENKIAVVLIDYFTASRSAKYVKDLIDCSDITIACIAIVDNSCDDKNYDNLVQPFVIVEDELLHCDENIRIKKALYRGSILLFIQNDNNSGFAKGNNLGERTIKRVMDYDYIVFSNNDLILPKEFKLSLLLEDFTEKSVGLVGPKVVGLDKKPQSPCREMTFIESCFLHYFMWPVNKIWEKQKNEVVVPNEKCSVYRIIGAFMVFKCQAFCDIEGFDEETFMYCEESIISERLIRRGYCTLYDPAVTIVHEGGFSLNGTNTFTKFVFQSNEVFKSRVYYFRTYKNIQSFFIRIVEIIYKIYMFKRSVISKIMNK